MGYVLEAVLRAQVAKTRFADFKSADTSYYETPAVGGLKVPWDDRSLENRYPDEPNLRSTIGQMVEYMIDQQVPYGFRYEDAIFLWNV
ncbi:hypothetical protein N7527_006808 [Penicillium freii]|nr:hypothetical protein N7527_006808 [Penicillium freii]